MKRFTRLDAFTKTVEDARVRTTSGGIVTISSILVILYLLLVEWNDYCRVIVKSELIVDKGRGEKMEIHMNITFPRIPCELLTLDVMDVSGEVQSGVIHGVNKVRLQPASEGGAVIESKSLELFVPFPRHQCALNTNTSNECPVTTTPNIWDFFLELEPSKPVSEDAKLTLRTTSHFRTNSQKIGTPKTRPTSILTTAENATALQHPNRRRRKAAATRATKCETPTRACHGPLAAAKASSSASASTTPNI